MSDCPAKVTPKVTISDEVDYHDHPLTTEEPVDNNELREEVQDINDVDPDDDQVPLAVIVDKEDPNLYIPGSNSASDDEVTAEEEEEDHPQIIIDENKKSTMEDTDDEETDDELMRITEANRYISIEPKADDTANLASRSKSLRSQSVSTRRNLLVFSDHPTITKKSDRIIVHNHYGAGPSGQLENNLKPTRRSRSYLVACDFSDESFNAIEWTMGTMMRDGDKLYVVTAVNREDNPELVKDSGLSLSKELNKASEAVTEEAKKTLGQMLLFDVDLITYAICGKVKDVLTTLIEKLPLTMVVCGSRGRGTVKGLLMGSISTYLVHKSPVPVTVIRPQKKKKAPRKKPLHTAPLSQSVKSGQLAVDELSKTPITTETTPDPTPATTTATT